MDDTIQKNLAEDSEILIDLTYDFGLLLFRMSISLVCCFEQHPADRRKNWDEPGTSGMYYGYGVPFET